MSRLLSVTLRGEERYVRVVRDHGYEPDTNAHDVDWHFLRPPDPPPTDEEEQSVYEQICAALDDSYEEDYWP